ncbi:MAG TPA: response regulator transcription factor [Oscillatoriaceae cyanobacterium]
MIQETLVKTTRLMLADDHPIVLSGLKAVLSEVPDLEIVGEATNGLDAVKLAKQLQPDILLLDIHMPKLDGLAALPAIREQAPETKVIVLTSMEEEEYLFRVIQAGGSGYVLKRAADEELLNAIREVQAGGAFVRPPIARMLAADYMSRVESGEQPDSYEKLTPREKEVLALLARGYTNAQIADEFVLSVRTVETHRAHIMDKLGFSSRAQLVDYAMRKGYLA